MTEKTDLIERPESEPFGGWKDVGRQRRQEWDKLAAFLEPLLVATGTGPKYILLQRGLVEAIRNKVVPPGGLLPTEREFTRITPFSLGTVQRALKGLVTEGVTARRPGVGTIVVPWRWRLNQPLHTRFQSDHGDFMPVFTRVLSRRQVKQRGPWSDVLAGPGSKQPASILMIRRQLDVGGHFDIYNEFYIDVELYPVFLETPQQELDGVNFKRLLSREFDLDITSVRNHVGLAPAPKVSASILNVKEGATCLRHRVIAKARDKNLYYQDYWMPPHASEIVIDSALNAASLG